MNGRLIGAHGYCTQVSILYDVLSLYISTVCTVCLYSDTQVKSICIIIQIFSGQVRVYFLV